MQRRLAAPLLRWMTVCGVRRRGLAEMVPRGFHHRVFRGQGVGRGKGVFVKLGQAFKESAAKTGTLELTHFALRGPVPAHDPSLGVNRRPDIP